MTAGHALDDNDRFPWLEAIGEWLAGSTLVLDLNPLGTYTEHAYECVAVPARGKGNDRTRHQSTRRSY